MATVGCIVVVVVGVVVVVFAGGGFIHVRHGSLIREMVELFGIHESFHLGRTQGRLEVAVNMVGFAVAQSVQVSVIKG